MYNKFTENFQQKGGESMEIIDLYDENKELTGETLVRGEPMPQGRYKLSIHIWIMNSEGKVYIQKRAAERKIFPNKWENPGGGATVGQTSEQSFVREFEEELGISPDLKNSKLILTIKREKDFVDMWFVKQDFDIAKLKLQKEEVCAAKWATFEDIKEMIEKGEFCPTINQSLEPFLQYISTHSQAKEC